MNYFSDSLVKQLREQINQCISQTSAYAIFRYPQNKICHLICQEQIPDSATDFDFLDQKEGFVIAPFSVSAKTPIVCIKAEKSYTFEFYDSQFKYENSTVYTDKYVPSTLKNHEIYSADFSKFIKPLQNGSIDKLVLSRSEEIKVDIKNIQTPVSLFLKACMFYPDLYIALCNTPQTGCWLTATPELLLSGNFDQWKTVALAGTMPIMPHYPQDASCWSEKNRTEQECVASYIQQILQNNDIEFRQTAPYVVQAAHVAHLCSDFHFSLKKQLSLGLLIKQLYPTPAVCGFPKRKAYHYINLYEHNDRKYYSGFMGMHTQRNTAFYVSLRCMSINKNIYRLYAGGGILPQSQMKDEWKETLYKMNTMYNLIR